MKRLVLVFFVCAHLLCSAFKLGIENCLTKFPCKKISGGKKARIGLIANQTSCDKAGNRSVDMLLKRGFNVACIFSTEHGFDGSIVALKDVDDMHDQKTGVPIVSLYNKKNGNDRIGLVPKDTVQNLDCLIFDLQDAGMRHYTYLDTLLKAMQSAASHKIPIIVCDRPNFLGHRMEGPQGNPRIFKRETVGSLPLRHGMTVGEIARYLNDHVLQKKADLHIVPMTGYERTMDTKKYYKTKLSPNITSIGAVHGYSFLGVLGEVRPFDLGIGSEKAFQCILLPDDHAFTKEQWDECRHMLDSCGIESDHYRYFSTRKKKWYRGLEIRIKDIATFRAFETLLRVLEFFKDKGVELIPSLYFDTAVGNARVRLWLEGKIPKEKVIQDSKNEVQQFLEKSKEHLLYFPLPQISNFRLFDAEVIADESLFSRFSC